MKKIAVVYNSYKENILKYLTEIVNVLFNCNLEVSVLRNKLTDSMDFKFNYEKNLDDLIKKCDVVLVLGGDGTIMHFAKIAAIYGKYILGVNAGRIGFLSSLELSQTDKIFDITRNKFTVNRRMLMEVRYNGKSKLVLNEAALIRNLSSRISDYEVYERKKLICKYRSDGVIISTPTGSTAYSFSAGGPVVHPSVNCAVVTPICPYSVFSGSMVLPVDEPIIIKYRSFNSDDIVISIDGISENLNSKEGEIFVQKASAFADFINFENDKFCNIDKKILNKMV
ncbi:MAG: NAD(+)/NADH kinase [Acutalibacteraceae bacterium]